MPRRLAPSGEGCDISARCRDADARYQILSAPCDPSAPLWPSSNITSSRGVAFAA